MAVHEEAQSAIYDGVVVMVEKAKEWGGPQGAAMLRDAAVAYRAARGGSQPGVLSFESKS